jgi:rod shape-determining protein MreC
MLSAVTSQPVGGNAERAGLPYQNQIANLQARVDEVEKKYQQVAGFRAKHPFEGAKFITANITRATNSELIIDSGQKDGLIDGLFVFGDNGVIGTIAGVTAYTAKVRLITSSSCKLEVKIADKSAILQGDGRNIKIKTLPKTCPVQIGQQVFCQPKPGLLNTPIIVGTVSECRLSENPHLWDITVTPAADISALNSVGIIKY